MKQLRTLVVLGLVLVILLLIIDTIDAGKKEDKKKGPDTKNEKGIGNSKNGKPKNGKPKKSENSKIEKTKTLKEHSIFNSDQSNGECKFESTRINEKKGTKSGTKERKNIKVVNPKIIKTYQKVKKYKIVEEVPAKQTTSNKKTQQKNKPQHTYKKDVVDEVFKSIKKTYQKNIPKEENSNGDVLNEEGPIFVEEENSGNNQKRKKYMLVEVMLQDDEENQDGNETILEGLEDEDNLAGIQTTSIYADDEEEIIMEDNFYDNQDEDSYSSRYDNPTDSNNLKTCKPPPEDPNRQGPKKLTLYVIEEEVDGQIKKRVVPEEDGVTMCEVADLLQQYYYDGLN